MQFTWQAGFVRVLENLESPGIYYGIFQHWKKVTGPGKFWKSGSVGVNVNFGALERSIRVLEKSWKFVCE